MKIFAITSALYLSLLCSLAVNAVESMICDQTDVAVTAYNSNIALVRDRRTVSLHPGIQELTFMDVAQHIKPETVSVRSLNAPDSINILEQNYEFDLLSPSKILEKYLGKTVKLRNFSKDLTFNEVDAKLLSLNEGAIYQVGNEIHLNHPGSVVLPEVPSNLIAKPSLVWLLDNKQEKDLQDLAVTYITGGISWRAEYIINLDRSDSKLDLVGHVTLTNQSGTSYNNAQLKLVAGDIHRAPAGGHEMQKFARAAMVNSASLQQEAFGDYHLYKLPRRTTIKDNQTKQIHLLSGNNVLAHKIYEYRGQAWNYFQQSVLKGQKIGVYLKFKNSESNNMGLPLPAGTVRVYQDDSEGMAQLAGEDRISHTPRDEEVTLKLGDAFDLVAERRQTDYELIGQNVHQSAYEIKIRNHKDIPVTVNIIETLGAHWELLHSSHEYSKIDAFTITFPVTVQAHDEATLTYDVETST